MWITLSLSVGLLSGLRNCFNPGYSEQSKKRRLPQKDRGGIRQSGCCGDMLVSLHRLTQDKIIRGISKALVGTFLLLSCCVLPPILADTSPFTSPDPGGNPAAPPKEATPDTVAPAAEEVND